MLMKPSLSPKNKQTVGKKESAKEDSDKRLIIQNGFLPPIHLVLPHISQPAE